MHGGVSRDKDLQGEHKVCKNHQNLMDDDEPSITAWLAAIASLCVHRLGDSVEGAVPEPGYQLPIMLAVAAAVAWSCRRRFGHRT